MTEDEHTTPVTTQLERLGNCFRGSNALDHSISTVPASQVSHPFDPLVAFCCFFDIDAAGRSEALCRSQTFLRATDEDDLPAAVVQSDRQSG